MAKQSKSSSELSKIDVTESSTSDRKSRIHRIESVSSDARTAPEIVDYLIALALKKDASDIHIGLNLNESGPKRYLVRLRINGVLTEIPVPALPNNYSQVIARFRIMANLDPTFSGRSEDGQFRIEYHFKNYYIRLATLPVAGGEELTCRLRAEVQEFYALNKLGMSKPVLHRLRNLVSQKSGIIILNGPAGSGKTTTIYTILQTLAGISRKIVTVEDPVELYLPYVSHVQVNPKATFEDTARAFMRRDADTIFVGEIRSPQSALTAIQLAETGHLVFTTLHTRDSIGVISRLATFDIPSNYIASTLIGSLSQRLVDKLCTECRVEYKPDPEIVERIFEIRKMPEDGAFYKKGSGCKNCVG